MGKEDRKQNSANMKTQLLTQVSEVVNLMMAVTSTVFGLGSLVGSTPTTANVSLCGEVESREAHNLEVVGANPTRANSPLLRAVYNTKWADGPMSPLH